MTDAALILASMAEDKKGTMRTCTNCALLVRRKRNCNGCRCCSRHYQRGLRQHGQSSVAPSEPASEPAGDSSTPDHDHDNLAGWPRQWLPHLKMLLDDSNTPDHDDVSEAGMMDPNMLLDSSSTPTAHY